MNNLQSAGIPQQAGRGKREISEGIWDLNQAGTEKAEHAISGQPCFTSLRRLLLAAVPPLEWKRPGMTTSEDPNPPGAFSLFPPPALQLEDNLTKKSPIYSNKKLY